LATILLTDQRRRLAGQIGPYRGLGMTNLAGPARQPVD